MKVEEKIHSCQYHVPYSSYGEAIDYCYENKDLELWIGNGEYSSQINFCPFCGYKARQQVCLVPLGE